MLIVSRESVAGVNRRHRRCEWTHEGEPKAQQVGETEPDRYSRACMVVHSESAFWRMWVAPQEL